MFKKEASMIHENSLVAQEHTALKSEIKYCDKNIFDQ